MNTESPVRAAFNRACDYDREAQIQAQVAQKLARMFACIDPHVTISGLEVGCGTGFLSRLWLDRLPKTDLLLTDVAPAMVARSQENLRSHPWARTRFMVMDGEAPCVQTSFSLIAASLVFQWFRRPRESIPALLDLLAPGGRLIFATLGPDTFGEWRSLCEEEALPCGLHRYPGQDFWFDLAVKQGVTLELSEERLEETHPSPMAFLQRLKAIGAETPVSCHKPVSAGKLRRLLVSPKIPKDFFTVTHHVYFGSFINNPGGRHGA